MDIVFRILLAAHLIGLVMGMGGGLALSRVGPAIGAGSPQTRPGLWDLHGKISRIAKAGLLTMLVSGIAMVGVRYHDLSQMAPLFWVKMALVLVLIVSIAISVRAAGKAQKGDMAAAKTMKLAGMTSGITAAVTVVIAVFTFG